MYIFLGKSYHFLGLIDTQIHQKILAGVRSPPFLANARIWELLVQQPPLWLWKWSFETYYNIGVHLTNDNLSSNKVWLWIITGLNQLSHWDSYWSMLPRRIKKRIFLWILFHILPFFQTAQLFCQVADIYWKRLSMPRNLSIQERKELMILRWNWIVFVQRKYVNWPKTINI